MVHVVVGLPFKFDIVEFIKDPSSYPLAKGVDGVSNRLDHLKALLIRRIRNLDISSPYWLGSMLPLRSGASRSSRRGISTKFLRARRCIKDKKRPLRLDKEEAAKEEVRVMGHQGMSSKRPLTCIKAADEPTKKEFLEEFKRDCKKQLEAHRTEDLQLEEAKALFARREREGVIVIEDSPYKTPRSNDGEKGPDKGMMVVMVEIDEGDMIDPNALVIEALMALKTTEAKDQSVTNERKSSKKLREFDEKLRRVNGHPRWSGYKYRVSVKVMKGKAPPLAWDRMRSWSERRPEYELRWTKHTKGAVEGQRGFSGEMRELTATCKAKDVALAEVADVRQIVMEELRLVRAQPSLTPLVDDVFMQMLKNAVAVAEKRVVMLIAELERELKAKVVNAFESGILRPI
ncbi:hypothetical protein ACLOJK_011845 [Asimina triloba]